MENMEHKLVRPIGVFDSGYGGLTILREFVDRLPDRDFIYLGDNARNPYGFRSFEVVYEYTLEAVRWLFARGCPLVIIACNTSSAKALRTIQQADLPHMDPSHRVLGVIRPTVEAVDALSKTKHIGITGTAGTVQSNSYALEISKLFPHITVVQEACPMWVPLVENGEIDSEGTEYFVRKNMESLLGRDPDIDTVILGCTHYPLLMNAIRKVTPPGVKVISQDAIVAASLLDYLKRHPEMDARCSKGGAVKFFTTDSAELFGNRGGIFYRGEVRAERIML